MWGGGKGKTINTCYFIGEEENEVRGKRDMQYENLGNLSVDKSRKSKIKSQT